MSLAFLLSADGVRLHADVGPRTGDVDYSQLLTIGNPFRAAASDEARRAGSTDEFRGHVKDHFIHGTGFKEGRVDLASTFYEKRGDI